MTFKPSNEDSKESVGLGVFSEANTSGGVGLDMSIDLLLSE